MTDALTALLIIEDQKIKRYDDVDDVSL